MLRTGRVTREAQHGVEVCFERLAACHGCNACGREKKSTTVFVYGKASVGDTVSVEMPDAQVLRASLLTYLLPLAGLLGGLMAGSAVASGKDGVVVLSGLVGLAISVLLLKEVDRRLAKRTAWQPRIVEVNPSQDGDPS
ncbi:MAG: SoxR reducing system RseC family protein [Clostridiales bacterium]|nr:SoxR reducing system RseC family protein [Clostridiales bacterium]